MARPLVLPRCAKPKPSLPSHYYEGFLEKKGPLEKDYKKFWTGLRGLALYFYNTNRDTQVGSSGGWFLSSAMCVFLFQVENLESREMWKGFILTVVELKVPSSLTLLPGHIYMMSEALDKEQEPFSSPSCFYKVSRTEAQVLLEKNEDSGNMLLRPGGDGKSVSVTTRQVVNGNVALKHYRVNQLGQEYIVDVEQPYRCSSLAGVVDYFVSNTNKALVPLCLDESYAGTLGGLSARRSASVPAAGRGRGFVAGVKLPPPYRHRLPTTLPPVPAVSPSVPPAPSPEPENVYEEEEEDQEEQTYVNDAGKSRSLGAVSLAQGWLCQSL
uniref:Signal transducing adaptor family member 2 n=1 Tax=Sphenodon punctatus TaxID=8508 RepID=A0A8D0H3F0_SPHPU